MGQGAFRLMAPSPEDAAGSVQTRHTRHVCVKIELLLTILHFFQ